MTETTITTSTPALFGGQPTRPQRKSALPVISAAAKQDVLSILDDGTLAQFYGGRHVRAFEEAYAKRFNRTRAVAVSSGTAALHLAFLAARLPERAEVLVPANAYVSAASALLQANLIPVIVDIDEHGWSMDPVDCARKITDRTAMMVPVHMYGQPCPMAALTALAAKHDLLVVEDCGQAHGALADGALTGTFGIAAAYSLCCRKHIAVGEGGMVITDDDRFAEVCKSLAHKGKGSGWFDYLEMGFSYNMTEIQACLGRHQLEALDEQLATRSRLAARLRESLADIGLSFPGVRPGSTHAYFKQNALVPAELGDRRNQIVDAIRAENVGCDPAHPHLLEIAWLRDQAPSVYRALPPQHRPDYGPDAAPAAKRILGRQICIEVGPGLDDTDIDYTVAAIRKVMAYFATREGTTR